MYIDYQWDLNRDRIILDEELNLDKLGWKHGDYFRVTNIDGRAMLVRVDPIEKFLLDGIESNKKDN